jgi:protein-S-isoprenylcysteine O-methyltransferase Ste14
MSLIGRWTDLIYRVATGDWKAKLFIAPIVGASYIGLIVIFILLSRVVDRWLSLPKVSFYPVSHILGYGILSFGLFLMVLSMAYFLKVRGTPVPFSPPPKLVANGPYRFIRNPMLTGIFIQLFGLAVAFGSLSLAFIFMPLFILINVWELKKIEEPELARRLGEAYIEYKEQVPMFFPFGKTRQ